MEPPVDDVPYFGGTDITVPPTHIRAVHGRPGTEEPQRLRLGEALVEAGVITAEQLSSCLAEQAADRSSPRRRLGEIITSRRLATELHIAAGLARLTGFSFVDYAGLVLDPDAIRRLPRAFCHRHLVLPLGAGETWVRLAMADPSDRVAVDAVREITGATTISIAIATRTDIEHALERAWSVPEEELARQLAERRAAEPDPVLAPPAPVEPQEVVEAGPVIGTPWDYLFVGDGMPMDHPGYVNDATALDLRLAELGALGWEAVGVHSNGSRVRVLLKRPRTR